RNMRETCARVLSAALMTGAIATVVGLATLSGTPNESGRPIAAPTPSVQHSVQLRVQPAPRHRRTTAQLVTADTIHIQPRTEVATRSLVVVRRHRFHRPVQARQLAAAKPHPAPAVAPPAPAAAPPPVPAEPTPPPTGDNAGNGDEAHAGQGHGHE